MRLRLVPPAAVVAAAAVFATAPNALAATTGLDPVRVSGATDAGALSRSAVPVTIVLAPRDKAGLDRAAKPAVGLTPAQFNTRFAPSATTVQAVRTWAAASGLTVSSVSANRLLVRASGSAAAVGKAFGTTLHSFRAPSGSTFFAPATRAAVPAAFAGQTTAVLGLSDLGRVGADPTSVDIPRDYTPQQMWSLYDAPSGTTGAGQTVSVITEGDLTQVKKDLVTFEDTYGLPHVAWTQVQVGTPSTDTSGSDEWDLDTQWSTGMAPDVSGLRVYTGASLSNDDILATINQWVTEDATHQASFSAGECELLAFATGFTGALDTVLEQAAAQGQTLFVSSGDTGVFCSAIVGVNGVPAGIPSVAYPASSPWAMGVGGTTVLGPGPNEIGWYAGGGGSSYFEATPDYQASAGGSFLGINRGVPDVALDADPNSGYDVVVGGQVEVIGGTSASAPSWQGIWAGRSPRTAGRSASPAARSTPPRRATSTTSPWAATRRRRRPAGTT